jgi:hypothetical protein
MVKTKTGDAFGKRVQLISPHTKKENLETINKKEKNL